jgi:hypothetical protein
MAHSHPAEVAHRVQRGPAGLTLSTTGSLLWYQLYLNLEQLMEVSAALRLGMESPARRSES